MPILSPKLWTFSLITSLKKGSALILFLNSLWVKLPPSRNPFTISLVIFLGSRPLIENPLSSEPETTGISLSGVLISPTRFLFSLKYNFYYTR